MGLNHMTATISAPTLSTWSTRHHEEAFRIEIPGEEAEKFRTLGDIIDYTGLHEKPRESKESLLKKKI
jgi:hypothetical protein